MGSPTPSQILLQRVASPNHLASQHTYVDSPRSVPADYSQYSAPAEQPQFDYDQNQELYGNDDPHIYDFGPNGALVDAPFAQPQVPQASDVNGLVFMVSHAYPSADVSLPLLFKYNLLRPCTISFQITSTRKLSETL